MLTKTDLLACLKMRPERIIDFLRQKNYKITWDWYDTWQEAHARAFTVAKVTRLDILQDLYNVLEDALEQGQTSRWYRQQLEPILKDKGWWGRITETRPDGEQQEIQAGNPWRMDTIFRTNTSSLYSAGRWESQVQDSTRPYWLYVAVRDSRTRPGHMQLHGQCFPASHPFWQSFYPPNGWNCRCSVIALSAAEVKARGIVINGYGTLGERMQMMSEVTGEMKPVATWTADGKTVSPDAGFSYNPGMAWHPDLAKYQGDLAALARELTL